MKTSTLFRLLAVGALSWCPAGAATTVVLDKAAAAIAQITTTEMIFPGGAPNFYPTLAVGGDTTAGGSL